MKKTFRKTLLKDIKKNFSRFLAIIAIVALGVGFLIGLLSATPDLQYSVDQYYDQQNMYDLQIKSTIGFDEEDVISLKEDVPEIEEAIGYYQIDLVGEYQNQDVTVRKIVTEMDSPINRMELVLGRYPQNENEVIVQQKGIFWIRSNWTPIFMLMEKRIASSVFAIIRFTTIKCRRSLWPEAEPWMSFVGLMRNMSHYRP